MNKILTKYKLALAMLLCVGVFFAAPLSAYAQLFPGARDEACRGANLSEDGSCDAAADAKANSVLTNGINIFSIVIGVIAVIMVMIAGVKYIASSGDPNSVNSAKNTLLYAVIGLIVVALAQVITRFVLSRV